MPNFDPAKLSAFLQGHPDLNKDLVTAIPDEKEKAPPSHFKVGEEVYLPLSFDKEHDDTTNPDNRETKEFARRGYKKFIVETIENGKVIISSAFNSERKVAVDEDELLVAKLDSKRVNLQPLSELSAFNDKIGYDVRQFLGWKRRWVDSGDIDAFRKQYGTLTIPDEVIEAVKKEMNLYIEILQTPEVGSDYTRGAAQNLWICARILTGVQNPESNDIESIVEELKARGNIGTLARLQNALDTAHNKKATTPITTTVTAIPTVAAPISAPEPVKLKNVRDLWPRYISYDQKKGWSFLHQDGRVEGLPNHDWTSLHENIKPIFDAYIKFILDGNAEERTLKAELYEELIDIKNDIIKALSGKDVDGARTSAVLLTTLLDEAEKDWKSKKEKVVEGKNLELAKKEILKKIDFKKVEAVQKEVEDAKTANISPDRVIYLERLCKKVTDLATELKAVLESHDTDYSLEELKEMSELLTVRIKAFEDAAQKEKEIFEKVNQNQYIRNAPVLRPIPRLTKNNENMRIHMLGRKDAVTLKEYNEIQERKNAEANKMTLTEEQLRDLPELQALGYQPGDELDTKLFKKAETGIVYERLYNRDQNAFITSFTVKTPNGHYISSDKLKMYPSTEQDIIKGILQSHGIVLNETYRTPKDAEDRAKREKDWEQRNKHRVTFHPDYHKGILRKKDVLVKNFSTQENMGKSDLIFTAKEHYERLKKKRELYADDKFTKRLEAQEQILDEEAEKAVAARGTKKGEELTENFKKNLALYEHIVNSLEDAAQEPSQEEQQRKLKKIEDLLAKRTDSILKKLFNVQNKRKVLIRALLVGAVASGSVLYGKAGEEEKREEQPVPQKQEQVINYLEQVRNKKLLEDLMKRTPTDVLASTYIPLSIDQNKTSSTEAALNMVGQRVLKEEACYAMNQGQQLQVCDFIRDLEDISQKIPNVGSDPSDHFITTRTLGEYIKIVQDRLEKSRAK